MEWSLHLDEGDGPVLMFATRNSGDIPLELTCREGGGEIEIATLAYDEDAGPGRLRLTFRSGPTSTAFAARVAVTEFEDEGEYPYAEARLSSREPLLRAFASTGRLSEEADRTYLRDATTASEREAIRRFFELCG
ncbi:hypothetical protein G3573_09210 [Caulobacter sp. 17J65-9]|nr:hypothetical protein [Caulobacter sp. 17J65-9]